ncbi:MAG: glycoside hydrolase family 3 protein [Bacteroidia bacterium]
MIKKPPFSYLLSDSIQTQVQAMSLRQRIAQLIHVAAWSNRDEEHYRHIESLVQDHEIGGIIFFQGTPKQQALLTNRYQKASDIPLMISIDGEWGLAMRLDDTMAFPYSVTLGAIPDSQIGLIEEMGYEIGMQCRRLGIHVNFAPVVDINTEPSNPVIGFRSFGRNKEQVAKRAAAYARGLQAANVIAVAKHFPGHGDTTTDSHHTLPVVDHPVERLQDVELFPFKALFAEGVAGVMTGHIQVPALDPSSNRGASLSQAISYTLLQEELGYQGLIFTDALNMKGASDYYKPGALELEALKAGNDVLLYCEDVPAAIDTIEAAILSGKVPESWLNTRVEKQLAAKAWLRISDEPIGTENLAEDLHSSKAQSLNLELHHASLKVLNAYPHDLLRAGKVAALAFQAEAPLVFHQYWEGVDCMYWKKDEQLDTAAVIKTLQGYDQVLISVHASSMKAGEQFGVSSEMRERILEILTAVPAVLVLFGHPILLPDLTGDLPLPTVLAWQDSDGAQRVAAGLF